MTTSKVKNIQDSFKHVMTKMGIDLAEIHLHFETVENAFNSFSAVIQVCVKLVPPLIIINLEMF